jgi:hypothetical protein
VPTSLFGKITTTTNWSSIHPSERFMIGRGDCVEEDMSPVPDGCISGLHRCRLCSRPASSDLGRSSYHVGRVKATCEVLIV